MNKLYLLSFFALFFWSKNGNAQAPSWSIDPANFQYNMSLTAQIHLDGTEYNVNGDTLAAFVGTELRGLAYGYGMPNGKAYYFLTIYSNVADGETVSFKANLSTTNLTHFGGETFEFERNGQVGGFPEGFIVNITSENDFPPAFSPMPADTVLSGMDFDTLQLSDFLVSVDQDPVTYSVAPGSNLEALISLDNKLIVKPTNGAWIGSDSVEVTVTENTSNGYANSQWVKFNVLANYASPSFSEIPTQAGSPTVPFPTGNLNDYLTFGGTCLDYDIKLTLPTGAESNPNWTPPNPGIGNMSLSMQAHFSGKNFTGNGLELAGYVDGNLAGTATPSMVGEVPYYFLTLANVGSGPILFKLYDGDRQYIHEKITEVNFQPNGSAAFAIEFAPISIATNKNTGTWTVTVLNEEWYGEQAATASAIDCNWTFKNDAQAMTFQRALVLPVELSFFHINPTEANQVQLDWTTASEKDNEGFEIQRSNDGKNWRRIGFIEGNGNTLESHDYDFLDTRPDLGKNYYRLRISDFDGDYSYSPIRSVE